MKHFFLVLTCLSLFLGLVHSRDATVHFSGNSYSVTEGIDTLGVAYGSFSDDIEKDGWGKLHIETNPQYADTIQMFAAGYLEGYLTADRIYEQYVNIYSSIWGNTSFPMPPELTSWMNAQNSWAHDQAKKYSATDPYWAQVNNILNQFDGLYAGYNSIAKKPLSLMAFIVLNGVGDLLDLVAAFGDGRPTKAEDWTYTDLKNWIYSSHCSSLIKVTGDLSNIYAGHTSWYVYPAMLRISKYYNFPLNGALTAASEVAFSSYPGFLESLDDFYITSQELIVIETSNSIFNHSLYASVRDHHDVLLSWQRTLLANRLSRSGEDWGKYYSRHNSGTYNNQWIIVDLKRFKPYDTVGYGTLTILEQIPTYIKFADQSHILEKGYWASYNVPFYREIFDWSGYPTMSKIQPIMLNYDTCCRANIFRRDQGKVHDLQTFKDVLRYNDYKNDPYSQGNPGYSISSRFDLEEKDPGAFGGYDNKATDYHMAKGMLFHGLSGPTDVHDIPPFAWDERNKMFEKQSHIGQPNLYKFDYVTMKPKYFQ